MSKPESGINYIGPERRRDVTPLLPRRGHNRRKADAKRKRIKHTLTCLTVFFALYPLVGYFIIPSIINNLAPRLLSNEARVFSIGRSSFDPFRLILNIKDLTISQTGMSGSTTRPLIKIGGVQLNIESISIFKKALICQNADFKDVEINIVREMNRTYNLADLTQNKKAQKDLFFFKALPPFSLHNISLTGGALYFDDIPTKKKHRIEQILLNLPLLTNLDEPVYSSAEQMSSQLQPRFAAVINGNPVAIRGRDEDLTENGDSKLELQLHAVDLAEYFPYLPVFKDTEFISGHADLDLELIFSNRGGVSPPIQLRGKTFLTDISVRRKGGSLLTLPETSVTGNFIPLSYRLDLDQLVVNDPVLAVQPNNSGFNPDISNTIQNLVYEAALRITKLGFKNVVLARGTIYSGTVADQKNTAKWTDILIEIQSEKSDAKNASFSCMATSTQDITIFGHGTISAKLSKIHGVIETTDLDVEKIRSAFPVSFSPGFTSGIVKKGSINFSLSHQETGTPECILSGIALKLKDAVFHFDDYDLFFPSLMTTNGTIDRRLRIFNAGDIIANSAAIELNPELFTKPTPQADESKPVSWALSSKELVFSESTVSIGTTHFENAEIAASRLSTVGGLNGTVKITAELPDNGHLSLSGDLTLIPPSASLSGEIEQLPLVSITKSFSAFIPDNISSGSLSGKGVLTYPLFTASGDISVQGLSLEISPGKKNMSCRLTTIKEAQLTTSPNSLTMEEIVFDQPRFDIVVTDRKNPPLSKFIFPDSNTASISSKRVAITGGSLRMIDYSSLVLTELLITPISATMKEMSNKPGRQAPFELRGAWQLINPLEEGSDGIKPQPAPIKVNGQAALFGGNPKIYASITSDTIDINTFATFLGPLIGYQPDKGDISIQADIHLANSKINAENIIKVKGLSLGQGLSGRYNTPLTAALLSDTESVITINAPVSGKITDTSFSYGEALSKTIRNLLQETTLSPFSLLDIDTKYKDSNPEFLSFTPGSAELTDEQIQFLQNLADAILNKPLLRLSLSGQVDPKLDIEALQDTREIKGPLLVAQSSTEESVENPEQKIRIKVGSPIGEDELVELAKKRIKNVKNQLISHGIPETRIHADMDIIIEDEVLNRPSARVDLDLHAGTEKTL